MFHIVLVEPEIAGNTGTIARTCMATGCQLHLIRPLGFRLTDDALKRSGMDYWDDLNVKVHSSFQTFRLSFEEAFANKRVFSLTTKGVTAHSEISFAVDDVFLFGPESRGLPGSIRQETRQLRIPMTAGTRSLNLAVSASVVMYEAWRQIDYQA